MKIFVFIIFLFSVFDSEAFLGEVVGDGQCFADVKAAAGCPATAKWIDDALVKGASLARGTAIATFQNHSYGNFTDGRSHAAIYLSQDAAGLTVIDQWKNQVAHQRVIRFKGGTGSAVNDGDAFAVIEDKVVMNRAN